MADEEEKTDVPDVPKVNGEIERQKEKYRIVRSYVVLVVAVGLIIYGVWPPTEPAIFTFGGAMLGITPVVRATV